MDLELLIACVYERPAIWQSRHKNHFNRGLIDKYWNEIALALQTTRDSARTKWKNMKDQYRKEVKKIKKNTAGDDDDGELQLSRWPFFSLMHFLKEEILQSNMSGNLNRSKKRPHGNNDSEDEDNPTMIEQNMDNSFYNLLRSNVEENDCRSGIKPPTEDQPQSQASLPTQSQPNVPIQPQNNVSISKKRKETVQETVIKKMLALEERKFEILVNKNRQPPEEDSEDYYFLMSLLPHLKKIGSSAKA